MERLDKIVADRMNISRKEAGRLIRAGRVSVGGVALGRPEQHAEAAGVAVDGKTLTPEQYSYLMLNKPQGVVCATRDNLHQTVLELVPPELKRKGLFPAGRLDRDTEGFVLLTDDGPFAHRILSPKNHVPKTYHVTLDRPFDVQRVAASFADGMELDGGETTRPAELRLLRDGEHPVAEVVIREGKYHQIKRMFAQVALEVIYLRRVAIGGLWLDERLQPGECRSVSLQEFALMVRSVQTD